MIRLPASYPQYLNNFLHGRVSAGSFVLYLLKSLIPQVKAILLDSLADVLPVALTVAGAVLVVNLGWRLFRNFTRG